MSAAPTAGNNRSCTIETRPISFGAYDTLEQGDVTAIGQVIYTCSGGGGGNPGGGNPGGPGGGNPGGPGTTTSGGQSGIRIEMAQGSSNSFAPRHMYGGMSIDNLDYNIYLDSTHRQVWGTGEGPTLAYVDAHPPNGTPVIVPAFGRIFGGQDISWGPYTDTVPVRILF
jgi:spore coat protein U-like protein